MRWHQHGSWLARFAEQQGAILSETADTVKAGGRLVYATCSLLRRENEDVVERFVGSSGGGWSVDRAERIGPEKGGPDGFFAACLRRAVAAGEKTEATQFDSEDPK